MESNLTARWLIAEAEAATGLDAWEEIPDEVDFSAGDEVVQVDMARDRPVLATPRERQWSEEWWRVKAVTANPARARLLSNLLAARFDDRLNVPGPDGSFVHYCGRVGQWRYSEKGPPRVYHRGPEVKVKIQAP